MQNNNIKLARVLRKTLTDAERKLWQRLRCRELNGLRFRRQVPLGRYIVDFACFDPQIVIEVDGGQHADEHIIQYDKKRTEWLESRGYTIMRFWNDQIMGSIDDVIEAIWNHLFPIPTFPRRAEGSTRFQRIRL